MPKPVLLAVCEQPNDREALQRELVSRYSTDYEVICEASPVAALIRNCTLMRNACC
jgi:hypothetical protein